MSSIMTKVFTEILCHLNSLPVIIIVKLVTAGIISLISIDLLYTYYLDERNKYLLNKTVKRRTQPDVKVSENNLVPQPEIPEISKWKRAITAFKSASAMYKKKYGRPPIIIYNNVSRLIAEHPKILDTIQDDVKDNADDQKYIAVFVSSEGSVPRRMEYEEVNELYGLVGGRIMDLKIVTDKFLDEQFLEDIKQQTLTEVEKKFQSAQLFPNDLYYEIGKNIISDLLKSKELNFLAFKKHFKKAEELNEVLGNNIFIYYPGKNTMSFQSQSVESYIQKMTNIFVK
ncbi:hypothetical protein C1645_823024 [Glomus cerebriforme]|uniref:Uncharacterized protein n=1 Tax=Glomus cerebriforme TaxID=658196 RepID=A0A397T6S6_9GLOM|nr:hypothetical protein C1645_823024 [Glomus cerebriforme]